MLRVIKKKIEPKFFTDVVFKIKKFEIRKDEDDIQVGDILLLQEYENGVYTGRETGVEISYVLRDAEEYGLMKGYCIISWK